MSATLRVRWTVTPTTAPQPIRPCNSCKRSCPFRSSGKFRLNASGKRLDAWLIYKCTHCDGTWNRTLFERRTVKEIGRKTLDDLQCNAPELAERIGFDMDSLRRHASEIRQFADATVSKHALSSPEGSWSVLTILIEAPLPLSIRADRLLASSLNIPRGRLQRLAKSNRLALPEAGKNALRRPVRDGLLVAIDLTGVADRSEIGRVAQE